MAGLFSSGKPIIGMVHLDPLPGSPRWAGSLEEVQRRALSDATILAEEGMDGILIENFGDAPFYPETVPPWSVAAMAVLARAMIQAIGRERISWGINVLRNDASAALSVALAAGGSFIRVNVHTGATATDQGLLQGRAHETLRLRASLAPDLLVLADARVKHGSPLRAIPLEEEVADLAARGLADAILITGSRTGAPPTAGEVRNAARAAGGVPVLAASGVTEENVAELLPFCRGIIVGTALKTGGRTEAPVERERVRRFLRAAREVRG